MKKIEGFKMRQLCKEYIVLPESSKLVNFNKMISFNSSAAYLWEAVGDKEFSVEDLTKLLLDKYEVDPQTAGNDAGKIAESWINAGIVEK